MGFALVLFLLSVVAGLAVLALVGWRLWGQVKLLTRVVAQSSAKLAAVAEQLEQVVPREERDGKPS